LTHRADCLILEVGSRTKEDKLSFCTGKDKVYRDKPVVVDPYSPSGKVAREETLAMLGPSAMRSMQAAREAGGLARAGAYAPGWRQAQDLASQTIQGQFLGANPYLERSLAASRRATLGQTADVGARLADQYQRAGLGFSTAAQQAQQGQLAATGAQLSASENQARLANYLQERQNQQAAVQMLQQATATPAAMMAAIPGLQMQPVTQAAAVAQGLGQDQVTVPGSAVVKQPGALDYGIAAMGAMPNL
jgi:hypothetical protein